MKFGTDFTNCWLNTSYRRVGGALYHIKKKGYLQHSFLPVVAQKKYEDRVYDVVELPEKTMYVLCPTSQRFLDHNKHIFERVGNIVPMDNEYDLNTNNWTWLFEVIGMNSAVKELRKVYVPTNNIEFFNPNEPYEWGLRFGEYTMPYSTRLIRKTV